VTAIAALRETFQITRSDAKFREREANANIESAAGATPAIFAMAVVRGPDQATEFVCDSATEAPPRDCARHGSASEMEKSLAGVATAA
jgi:hypothetical protein